MENMWPKELIRKTKALQIKKLQILLMCFLNHFGMERHECHHLFDTLVQWSDKLLRYSDN